MDTLRGRVGHYHVVPSEALKITLVLASRFDPGAELVAVRFERLEESAADDQRC
jgi:hypothetical protein